MNFRTAFDSPPLRVTAFRESMLPETIGEPSKGLWGGPVYSGLSLPSPGFSLPSPHGLKYDD